MSIEVLFLDDRLVWRFRGIVKAIIEDVGVDVIKVARKLCKLKSVDKDIELLVELSHACREDNTTYEVLGTLVWQSKNPYVRYDKQAYSKTKKLINNRP